MNQIFKKKALIVSCQAEGDDPFNSPQGIALFARAAEIGGSSGIRSEGLENIKKIISIIDIPVIGLTKTSFDDGTVKITGSFAEVEKLCAIGCMVIAIDGTFRLREGLTGPAFISSVKDRFNCIVMADISSVAEARACQDAGADFISTTLNGYTPTTFHLDNGEPNYHLVEELISELKIPVFAEGRISCPKQAKRMIDIGAHGVVVGTMITRPRIITSRFVAEIR